MRPDAFVILRHCLSPFIHPFSFPAMFRLSSLALVTMTIAFAAPAYAAGPFLLHAFELHGFDEQIPATLGYDSSASVVYFREMGALTSDELLLQQQHETAGCYPFYLMKEGEVVELGFNCRTFFCVGYQKGPKQCKDLAGETTGGVVEISRRMNGIRRPSTRMYFDELEKNDRTQEIQRRIEDLRRIACRPFYLMDFDVAVGEGFSCDEVGTYPAFSAARTCTNDWRTLEGVQCTVPLRQDEEAVRQWALRRQEHDEVVMSGVSLRERVALEPEMAAVSGAVVVSAKTEMSPAQFPDVRVGSYGYTAITSLADEGLIHGYDDGTFKPKQSINRAEFVRLAIETLRPNAVRGESECFPDVGNRWYAPFACAAKRLGVVKGYADGMFKPMQPITKAEALKVLLMLAKAPESEDAELPRGVADGEWYAPFVRTAVAAGVIRETVFPADTALTRADTAVWLYRLRQEEASVATRR